MLSRTILVALVSAACFATVNAADCSSKNEKCCQQLQDSKNLDASTLGLLGLLGVDVGSLTGNVGVQCKRPDWSLALVANNAQAPLLSAIAVVRKLLAALATTT
jgi:hypothetical protein